MIYLHTDEDGSIIYTINDFDTLPTQVQTAIMGNQNSYTVAQLPTAPEREGHVAVTYYDGSRFWFEYLKKALGGE